MQQWSEPANNPRHIYKLMSGWESGKARTQHSGLLQLYRLQRPSRTGNQRYGKRMPMMAGSPRELLTHSTQKHKLQSWKGNPRSTSQLFFSTVRRPLRAMPKKTCPVRRAAAEQKTIRGDGLGRIPGLLEGRNWAQLPTAIQVFGELVRSGEFFLFVSVNQVWLERREENGSSCESENLDPLVGWLRSNQAKNIGTSVRLVQICLNMFQPPPNPPPKYAQVIACGALFSARTTPRPPQNPGGTLVEPYLRAARTTPEPI